MIQGTFKLWTITYINLDGVHSHQECETKEDVKEIVDMLVAFGIDKDRINIFPPNSNVFLF